MKDFVHRATSNPLRTVALIVGVIFLATAASALISSWRYGKRVAELEKVERTLTDSIAGLQVEKAQWDTVRLAYRDTVVGFRDSVHTLSVRFANRPVRVIRRTLPGRSDTVMVVVGQDTTPISPEIAEHIDRCRVLLTACEELARTSEEQARADSTGIAQRDSIIAVQEVRHDSTMKLVSVLKKRNAYKPFTVAAGVGWLYNMAPCGGTTTVVQDDVYATASQECSRSAYGPGVMVGLDLRWTVEKIGGLFGWLF